MHAQILLVFARYLTGGVYQYVHVTFFGLTSSFLAEVRFTVPIPNNRSTWYGKKCLDIDLPNHKYQRCIGFILTNKNNPVIHCDPRSFLGGMLAKLLLPKPQVCSLCSEY